jgi:hypothetical protein
VLPSDCPEFTVPTFFQHSYFRLLETGDTFTVPTEKLQGLQGRAGAGHAQWDGRAVRWHSVDAQFTVSGLVEGRYGGQNWMKRLAAQ